VVSAITEVVDWGVRRALMYRPHYGSVFSNVESCSRCKVWVVSDYLCTWTLSENTYLFM